MTSLKRRLPSSQASFYVSFLSLFLLLTSITTKPSPTTFAFAMPPLSSSKSNNNADSSENDTIIQPAQPSASIGRLEELKQQEAKLSALLTSIRQEKLAVIRSRPLTIGIIGFGRFGQFIAKTFSKYAKVIVTSRSDYTSVAQEMGVIYTSSMSDFVSQSLDVIVISTSITSFESMIMKLVPHLRDLIQQDKESAPLIVDVLSVKEHPRTIMLKHLPIECDVLCTHPMFGPDSGKYGWKNLNFVYERTRVDGVLIHEGEGNRKQGSVQENEASVAGMDRLERFLSIWEEEGCRMVPLSSKDHDQYAANSQFLTHLMGRILGAQKDIKETPIDTQGFKSVLNLVGNTMADSFDLFYGLYKYNNNSVETVNNLRSALDDVVSGLFEMEEEEKQRKL